MKLYVISISIMLAGCSKQEVYIDPAFGSQYADFQDDAASMGFDANTKNLIMIFGNPGSGCEAGSVGCCEALDTPTVTISRTEWEKLDATQREMLVYHELGHCILGRSHNQSKDQQSGQPESIMYPTAIGIIPSWEFDEYRAGFIAELFGRGSGPTYAHNGFGLVQ